MFAYEPQEGSLKITISLDVFELVLRLTNHMVQHYEIINEKLYYCEGGGLDRSRLTQFTEHLKSYKCDLDLSAATITLDLNQKDAWDFNFVWIIASDCLPYDDETNVFAAFEVEYYAINLIAAKIIEELIRIDRLGDHTKLRLHTDLFDLITRLTLFIVHGGDWYWEDFLMTEGYHVKRPHELIEVLQAVQERETPINGLITLTLSDDQYWDLAWISSYAGRMLFEHEDLPVREEVLMNIVDTKLWGEIGVTLNERCCAKATQLARKWHGDQKRKYTGEPYINHLINVSNAVNRVAKDLIHGEVGFSRQDMCQAAILHDIIEDTGATLAGVEKEFGPRVVELVEWLTDVSKPEDGNRAVRKAMDREHLAKAPPEAKTIKLADLIDNAHSILEHDPQFAKVFISEMAQLLDVLKEGDQKLLQEAQDIVRYAQFKFEKIPS